MTRAYRSDGLALPPGSRSAPGCELMITVRYGPLVALGKAIDETWDKSVFSLAWRGK